jgi:hypothetical protein
MRKNSVFFMERTMPRIVITRLVLVLLVTIITFLPTVEGSPSDESLLLKLYNFDGTAADPESAGLATF